MAKNRVSSVSSFHGRPSPKVPKLRRHTSSESLFSLLRLKARFLNDSELCKLNSWFMSHAMQRTIKFWNDNTYFIHLQTFPCPLFHPRPNIPYNWQLTCYKHKFTKIVFICDYIAPAACLITLQCPCDYTRSNDYRSGPPSPACIKSPASCDRWALWPEGFRQKNENNASTGRSKPIPVYGSLLPEMDRFLRKGDVTKNPQIE